MEFFDFVQGFSVFILVETHVIEDEVNLFQNYFCDYNLKWIGAVRSHALGRAKEGMLLGIKKGVSGVMLSQIDSSPDAPRPQRRSLCIESWMEA